MDFKSPDGNYGYETEIHVRSDKQTRRSYLKFNLSAVPAGTTVTSAKLYLYCTTANPASPLQVDVHETNDSWSEGTITWNNAPVVGALAASNTQVDGTGQYYYWDITSYAQSQFDGDKILSVAVKFPLDDPYLDNPNYHRDFASKEYNGTSCDPYLEITYTAQAPVASFTYSPPYPVCNETVTFNASDSYDPDGSIVSYQWDFGDGNVTTVNDSIITHTYAAVNSTINYTVTLTVTDNDGLTNSTTATVPVTNPAILHVSLPAGENRTEISDPDPWLNECWLLNVTGASGTFTVRIEDTSGNIYSYDTHLVIALNDAAYNNLLNLTADNVTIVKNDFKNGTLRPYDLRDWPSGDMYPTWFNDTLVNVGTILPKGHVNVTVSVTFSNATGARMHFDAYGSKESSPIPPTKKCHITHNPLSEDSTVLFFPAPLPLSVSISPTSVTMDLDQSKTFTSSVSGGVSPYSYQWYLNGTPVSGANSSSWTFTPFSAGFYTVYLNVTDSVGATAKSNVANVTVNPQLTASISPPSATITLGQSVLFNSTVTGGTPPYNYQWDVNETWLPGETNPTFNFTPTQPGYYNISLLVTDNVGANASAFALVTVQPLRYYLTVQTDPPGLSPAPTPPSDWYDNCTYVNLTAPEYANVSADTRHRFYYWDVNGTSQGVNVNNITVHMDANYTATAHYILQYLVTFNQTGLDVSAIGTVVTVNSAPKNYSDLPFSMWADNGSSVTYNYSDIVSSTVSGKRFRLDSISSPPSSFTVTGPVTITGNYKTQYEVTFSQSGVGTDFTGTVVTIDGTGYNVTDLSVSFWWDAGSSHNFSFASPLVVNASKRYVWFSTSGLSNLQSDDAFTITSSGSVVGNYSTEVKYQITFDQTGVGSDFNDTIVIVDGTPYNRTALPVSFWWDNGTTHTFAFQSPLVVTSNAKQYVWNSTSGLSSLQSDTINVSMSGSVVGNYKTQYYLTMSTNFGTVIPGDGWHDAGSTVQISASAPAVVDGERYVWLGWTGIGDGNYTGMDNPANITMNSPITETASWRHEYRLIMDTNFGTTNPSVGEHWYEAGSTVEINATAPSVISGEQYVWLGWTGTGSGSYSSMGNPASIIMDGPINETAAWRHEYYLTVTSTYDSPTPTSGWFEAGTSIIASVTSPVSGPAGTRYVCTGWTGTGSVPTSGTTTSVTFTIDEPSSITWNWKTQYLLTVRTDPTGLSPQPTRSPAGEADPGGWWYDSSAYVQLMAQPVTNYDFLNWDVDMTPVSGNPITVHMDNPHTATAHYQTAAPPPPPPPAVGGHVLPINLDLSTSNSLIPQISLASTLSAVVTATIILVRRRKKTLKREH